MVAIVTDSSADLPADIAQSLGITVIPVTIKFGDRAYLDGQNLDTDSFYRLLQSESTHPTTSPPEPATFEQVFRALLERGDDVIDVTVAGSSARSTSTRRGPR